MGPLEIIVIIAVILFVGYMIGNFIYRKKKNLPTGDCAYCANKGNQLVKQFRKKYPKNK